MGVDYLNDDWLRDADTVPHADTTHYTLTYSHGPDFDADTHAVFCQNFVGRLRCGDGTGLAVGLGTFFDVWRG